MTRTITALYQTREDAQAAAEKLKAAGLGDRVDIHDQTDNDDVGASTDHDGGGFMATLRAMFGGHHDRHTYAEGVRRGHILLTARVDDLRATQAAELLDATTAVDLDRTESGWRSEGWNAPADGAAWSGATARVRAYQVEDPYDAPVGAAERAEDGVMVRDAGIRGAAREGVIGAGDGTSLDRRTDRGTSRPL
jgi:hypothetical protein